MHITGMTKVPSRLLGFSLKALWRLLATWSSLPWSPLRELYHSRASLHHSPFLRQSILVLPILSPQTYHLTSSSMKKQMHCSCHESLSSEIINNKSLFFLSHIHVHKIICWWHIWLTLHIKDTCWRRKGMWEKKKLQVSKKLIAGPRCSGAGGLLGMKGVMFFVMVSI